ncbi:MAG: helix-turn-helix domain containing protein [Candidatus Nanopelagicales bacterium]|nr:helix-turn-helix domain containing protein [Candidatus Nanopelagicales bacterium]
MTADDPVSLAVDRALKPLRDDAVRDVEAILDAALRVAERSTPAAPRVADIVAEAGTSNQAFYRYFSSKEDLMQAVMARGITRVRDYLQHRMSKTDDPAAKIELWIRGILMQATHQTAARQGAAVNEILAGTHGRSDTRSTDASAELCELLVEPLTALGSVQPQLDAQTVHEAAMGTMRRHLLAHTSPAAPECDHLVAFCLRGISVGA